VPASNLLARMRLQFAIGASVARHTPRVPQPTGMPATVALAAYCGRKTAASCVLGSGRTRT